MEYSETDKELFKLIDEISKNKTLILVVKAHLQAAYIRGLCDADKIQRNSHVRYTSSDKNSKDDNPEERSLLRDFRNDAERALRLLHNKEGVGFKG